MERDDKMTECLAHIRHEMPSYKEDASLNFQKFVNASFGGWRKVNHPQLDGEEGIENYVREIRKGRSFQ